MQSTWKAINDSIHPLPLVQTWQEEICALGSTSSGTSTLNEVHEPSPELPFCRGFMDSSMVGILFSAPSPHLSKPCTSGLNPNSSPSQALARRGRARLRAALSVAGAAVDSWDRMRVAAVAVLDLYPSPLPGLESPEALSPHLARVAQLLSSARSRESDAGGRLLALLQRKRVLGLGWRLRLNPDPPAEQPPPSSQALLR